MRTSKLVERIEIPWDSLTYVFPSIKTLWLAKNGLGNALGSHMIMNGYSTTQEFEEKTSYFGSNITMPNLQP